MNADGSEVRQVTHGNIENIHPTWSPDSTRTLSNTTYFAGATASDGRNVPSDNRVVGEKIDEKMNLATIGGGYTCAPFSPDRALILHRRVQGELSQIFVMKGGRHG